MDATEVLYPSSSAQLSEQVSLVWQGFASRGLGTCADKHGNVNSYEADPSADCGGGKKIRKKNKRILTGRCFFLPLFTQKGEHMLKKKVCFFLGVVCVVC